MYKIYPNIFNRNICFTLLLTLACTLRVAAQSVNLSAPNSVVQGQNFTVKFQFTDCNVQLSQPPALTGCTLRFGPATASYISMQSTPHGMQSTESVSYTYTYHADKAGKATIPSLSFQYNGKTLKTRAHTITILPPDKSTQQNSGYDSNSYDSPVSQNSSSVKPSDLIVTVTMSKQHVYEQEAVIATIKVYTKHDIEAFRATTLPSFEGFLSEELPVQNSEAQREHFRGENYYSVVLKRCLLYPQKAGKLTINSGRYDVTLITTELVTNGFAYTRKPVRHNITTVSNSVTVNVSALPTPQPADFSGAVGKFTATASLEPSLLRTNEAATYTYSVSGTGNIKYLSAPEIDFGANVEEYEPETENNAKFNGDNMSGTFSARYTIVPQQPGTLTIPARKFVFFNPSTEKYETINLPEISKKIIKGNNVVSNDKTVTDKKIEDIVHIKNLKNEQLVSEPQRILYSWWYWTIYAAIVIALGASIFIYRRQIKLNSDAVSRRSAKARKVAEKRLRTARDAMQTNRTEDFYAALSAAIWGYISDKLRIPASALTRDNISEKMETAGASQQLISETINILDACEMARFTPLHSNDEIATQYRNAETMINSIETSGLDNSAKKNDNAEVRNNPYQL